MEFEQRQLLIAYAVLTSALTFDLIFEQVFGIVVALELSFVFELIVVPTDFKKFRYLVSISRKGTYDAFQ